MTTIVFRAANTKVLLLLVAGLLVMVLAVMQDLIQYYFYDQNEFILREAVLFESFWLLFIPFSAIAFRFLRTIPVIPVLQRIYISLIATACISALHFLLYASLIFTASSLSGGHVFAFQDVLYHSVAEDLFICLLIYITVCAVIFIPKTAQPQMPGTPPLSQPNTWLEKMKVTHGTVSTLIQTNEIVLIAAASPYSCVHTAKGKFLYPDSLRSLETQLDPAVFVRVHKSTMVNITQVATYKSRQNGDYDLLLQSGETVRLSRNYKSHFRSHFG